MKDPKEDKGGVTDREIRERQEQLDQDGFSQGDIEKAKQIKDNCKNQ